MPNTEASSTTFLQEHTTIPIPHILKDWVDTTTNSYFEILERIPGQTVEEAWPTMSAEQKSHITRQTATALGQLRKLQSHRMQGIDDNPLLCFFLLGGRSGPFDSDEELWAAMAANLPETIPLKAKDALGKRMPTAKPYTFSHTDLAICNVMVQDSGDLAAIIDWEYGSFCPVWWEYTKLAFGFSKDDTEWKVMLRNSLEEKHEQALEFVKTYYYLCTGMSSYAEEDQKLRAEQILKELMSE